MGMFVGVDGGGSHAVRVIDAKGQVLDRFDAGAKPFPAAVSATG